MPKSNTAEVVDVLLTKRFFLLVCFMVFPGNYSFAEDNLILFPQRVGKVTAQTSEDDLAKIYGKNNLSRRILPWGDGGYYCATVLFEGTEKEISIFWREKSYEHGAGASIEEREKCDRLPPRHTPAGVSIATDLRRDPPRKPAFWKTPDGVFVGISLLMLEEINDAPIKFESTESCFDGGILSWNGGKLEKAKDLFDYSRISYSSEDVENVTKSGSVSSTDLMDSQKKKIFLGNIDFSFPHMEE